LEETLEAIDDLISQGKITYWGTSEWTGEQISRAYNICKARGWHLPVVNQPVYNLLDRGIEKQILPTCMSLGMGTANFSPLSQGILTGKYSGGTIPKDSRAANDSLNMFIMKRAEDKKLLDKVDALGPIAESYGLTMAQLSLAWILQHPGITSVITGASRVEQLESNVKASGVKLKPRDMSKINKLFPLV
jgi:aryl-alcohol dehydrogenase-like predicted oxidoreductase